MKNTLEQHRRLHKIEVDGIYSTMTEGHTEEKAKKAFRDVPMYYCGGKRCVHKPDKPCNPSCLLWADCRHGKENKDG